LLYIIMKNKWCTISPLYFFDSTLVPIDFNLNENSCVELADGVHFAPVPDWIKESKEILEGLRKEESEEIRLYTKFCLLREYTADGLGPEQEYSLRSIRLANLALWIAKPSSIGFNCVIHIEQFGEKWVLPCWVSFSQLIPHKNYEENKLSRSDLELAREIHTSLVALPEEKKGRDCSVWIAVNALWGAVTQRDWTLRYMMLWIALEALFGPSNRQEITFRLSQRIAFFLFPEDKEKAKDCSKSVTTNYRLRSAMVHGGSPSRSIEHTSQNLYDTEEFIRMSLVRVLKSSTLIDIFNGKNEREQYLDDQPYV